MGYGTDSSVKRHTNTLITNKNLNLTRQTYTRQQAICNTGNTSKMKELGWGNEKGVKELKEEGAKGLRGDMKIKHTRSTVEAMEGSKKRIIDAIKRSSRRNLKEIVASKKASRRVLNVP